jgi:(p)ppGpp synthase/HD superfamily hydrolase
LERAILYATEAHAGQVDQGKQPYILHPLRVLERLCRDISLPHRVQGRGSVSPVEVVLCSAVLHDTVEDTEVTSGDIAKNFGIKIETSVRFLTHVKGRAREEYILSIFRSRNEAARLVKLADLRDNASPERMRPLKKERKEWFVKKYSGDLKFIKRLRRQHGVLKGRYGFLEQKLLREVQQRLDVCAKQL